MAEIVTEDDLFKLFFKKPAKNGYKKPGDGFICYDFIRPILEAKSFGDGNKPLALDDESRFYIASFCEAERDRREAVVRQCDLRSVARSLNRGKGDLFIGYLGTDGSV